MNIAMNRYRTATSVGNQRASANTTCQKCLKKGHYSYECNSGVQERPYISRPSRTQQLLNPNLKPKLTNTEPNELLRRDGVADEQLATRLTKNFEDNESDSQARARPRRSSTASSDSVATVSTDRSRTRSRSHLQSRLERTTTEEPRRESRSRSRSRDVHRKRKRGASASSESRSPPRQPKSSDHKSRRFRSVSPNARGRTSSPLVDHRTPRSRSGSIDRSEVAKHRRSLDDTQALENHMRPSNRRQNDKTDNSRYPGDSYHSSGRANGGRGMRERSLSPYSRRLALTQAMNMDR